MKPAQKKPGPSARPWVLVSGLCLLLGFMAGRWLKLGAGPSLYALEHRLSGYQFISPLVECDLWKPGEVPNLRTLEKSIRELGAKAKARKQATHLSVYFRDLHNGPWLGIEEEARFSAASLLKVPVSISYLEMARKDPDLPFRPVRFEAPQTPFHQNIDPKRHLVVGETYPAEELARRMVVFSDNDAMQLLINLLGEENIRKTLSRMGVVETHLWEPDSVSVKEYAGFFRVLFNASLVDRDLSEKALSWLSEVEFRDGLVKHLPKNVKVAHKFGERDFGGAQQLHDCGIVYHPQRPYLLCVMTRGESREQLAPLIAEVSRLVYEQFPGEIAQSAEGRADVARAFDFSFGH